MNTSSTRVQGLLQTLGPGLLMAGAAIGGSHLVQSTRAGADYGFALLWAIVLANLFKYPFFQYGPRYSAATGETLLEGYLRLGRWAMGIFLLFTFCTMFVIEAALTVVTAGLAGQLFGIPLSVVGWSAVVLAVCVLILALGRYPLLDGLMKVIIVVLALSTVVAACAALGHGSRAPADYAAPAVWSAAGIAFVVALMGWMPSIVDISVWHSLWSVERRRQTGHRPSLREALFDFNLGYFVTAFLALAFLSLGAMIMYGTGEVFSNSGVRFAGQLVALYTQSLGGWAGPFIMVAAFTTMFSTTLAVTDAYPRVLKHSTGLLFAEFYAVVDENRLYLGFMLVLALAALGIVAFFLSGVKSMIDLATTLSFLTTPVLSYINYRVMMDPHVPAQARPGTAMRFLSWAGIAFWSAFALLFIYMKLGF